MTSLVTGATDFLVWDVGDVVRRDLGWQPRSLEQGMAELRDWFAAA